MSKPVRAFIPTSLLTVETLGNILKLWDMFSRCNLSRFEVINKVDLSVSCRHLEISRSLISRQLVKIASADSSLKLLLFEMVNESSCFNLATDLKVVAVIKMQDTKLQ